MLSSTQFFIAGTATSGTAHLKMYKVTFSNTSVDWANQMLCSGSWTAFYSGSMLSDDGSIIYSYFSFGISSRNMYFISQSVTSGSVIGSRYKSSVTVMYIFGSVLNGDYALATTNGPNVLVIFSLSTSTFTIKNFSGNLYNLSIELSSCR